MKNSEFVILAEEYLSLNVLFFVHVLKETTTHIHKLSTVLLMLEAYWGLHPL